MDLIRLDSMRKYHKSNPPVHISVARYLGIEHEDETPKVPTEEDIQMIMAAFQQKA